MENAIYATISHSMALRREMGVVANNIANMNTVSYKTQRPVFYEYLADTAGTGARVDVLDPHHGQLSMVIDGGVARDLRQGDVEQTGGVLDVAVDGDGFMMVGTDHGPRYTRHGRLAIDVERRLVDTNGLPVLNANDQPITIPRDANAILIQGDGTVIVDNRTVGRIRLVTFEDPQAMAPLGGGLLVTNEVPQDAEDTSLIQGMIETSNVEPITEMTRMIDISRKYESAQRLLQAEDDRLRSAIQKLGTLQA
jgi:flagellar basal-body rod protein FlgF